MQRCRERGPVTDPPPLLPTLCLQAVVRSLPDEPNLTITLTVGGKQRNLDRCGPTGRLAGWLAASKR